MMMATGFAGTFALPAPATPRKEAPDYRLRPPAGKANWLSWAVGNPIREQQAVPDRRPAGVGAMSVDELRAEIARLNDELIRAEWRIAERRSTVPSDCRRISAESIVSPTVTVTLASPLSRRAP